MVDLQRPEGREFDGYLSERDNPTGAPAVLVLQAWWGLIGQIRGVADRLVTSSGSFALVPDLFRGKTTIEEDANHLTNSLDFKLTTPRELGGAGGEGTNPEQLFAAGYSACFLGAMKFVASQNKIAIPTDVSVNGSVGIGLIPTGFGIEVELKISLPGMPLEAARSLVEKAHVVCPYSNATRGNIDVKLTLEESAG